MKEDGSLLYHLPPRADVELRFLVEIKKTTTTLDGIRFAKSKYATSLRTSNFGTVKTRWHPSPTVTVTERDGGIEHGAPEDQALWWWQYESQVCADGIARGMPPAELPSESEYSKSEVDVSD